jgi:hypothetical protein
VQRFVTTNFKNSKEKSTFWRQKVEIRVALGFLLAGNRLQAIFSTFGWGFDPNT